MPLAIRDGQSIVFIGDSITEAIHPNATGHLVIAEAVYSALSDG